MLTLFFPYSYNFSACLRWARDHGYSPADFIQSTPHNPAGYTLTFRLTLT